MGTAHTQVPGDQDPDRSILEGERTDRGVLRALFDMAPECIKIVAPDGRLLHMNPAGVAMVEADDFATIRGLSVADLVAPGDRAEWCAWHRRVCGGESIAWTFDIIGLRGTRRHMESHSAPITLDDGATGHLSITRDVTERARIARALHQANEQLERKVQERTAELEAAMARLKESERGFELLVRGVTDYAIFMLAPDGRVVSWNSGAERIKGYHADEIIGQHFSRFYTEKDRQAGLPANALRIAARDGRFETEGWRVRADGNRFWASVVIDPIYDDARLIGFAKVTRDITDKRAAEAQLHQAQKMEAIGQFTGGAAHDFNNLLMAILASLELLRKRLLPDDQRAYAMLNNAMQGVRRGATLTQRMLAFARRQELKQEAVDLAALVDGTVEFLGHSIGSSLRLHVAFPHGLPAVRTDAGQLETALLNLLGNARDAMPNGGAVTITAREEFVRAGDPAGLAEGRYVCLSVTDTGQGMDEATLARAAEPFYTTKGVGKGTGLGLSMVDGMVAQSGGKLAIHSKTGMGTTVALWLPVAPNDAGIVARTFGAQRDAGRFERQLLILVVDDDRLVLANLIAMLEDLGHRVLDATSGAAALRAIEAEPGLDLVITDQIMPGMTGFQLSETLRTSRPDLPVIIASGYGELPVRAGRPLRRLHKPFSEHALAEAIAAELAEV